MEIEKGKFNIIKTLEDWRWKQDKKEYFFEVSFYNFHNDINKCFNKNKFEINNPELAEKILLTHYLVYICDRQMDYRHIFKAGGYVISRLVEEYIKQRGNNKLEWNKIFKICRMYKEQKNGENQYSYFLCAPIKDRSKPNKKDEIYYYFKKRGRIINSENLKEQVKNKGKNKENETNELIYHIYGFEIKDKEEYALFSSRNMLQDIGCMYKTLKLLNNECLNYKDKDDVIINEKTNIKRLIYPGIRQKVSFGKFLEKYCDCICEYDTENKIIAQKGLAMALFELTYQGIPQINNSDILKESINIDTILNSISKKMVDQFNKKTATELSLEKNRHSLKRMWCIIRDFLVNPVFSECFRIIINKNKNTFREYINKNYSYVELPGDVWNNNSKFGYCFWGKSDDYKSSGFVRDRYNQRKQNKEKWGKCLPIHFDITFNFVPRMCEEDKCDICPLAEHSCDENIEKIGQNSNWKKLICPFEKEDKPKEKLCPVALYSCGIKHKCKGNKCPFE